MAINYDNIPAELKALRQWVLWRYELTEKGTQTKIPYAVTGGKASVSDPTTWCSFEEALAVVGNYSGLGFALSKDDPYTILDLDNKPHAPCTPEQLARHTKIFESFQSYTERSVSGTGVHIIVRGRIPTGVSRDNVDANSWGRYMVCTGDVIRNAPIVEYQALLDVLYGEMKPVEASPLVDIESCMSDVEIVEMAMRAVNADKFNTLSSGDMTGYPSQSEADFALLSIIAFYTQDNTQVKRIFRMSALGKRDKAKRDKYLNDALSKIRAKQPPPIDLTALTANAEAMLKQAVPLVKETPVPLTSDISLPPGLVGELAQYFYQTAIRPVREVALSAALALVAGTCGRSYNVSGTGLNQYLILLAKTGAGKEGAASGIENLLAAVRPQLPMVEQFQGPATFASGQALIKVLDQKPCFVSILGEFGLTLQQLSSSRANSAEVMLKKVLLDLYTKSGWNRKLHSSVYSDVEKNTKIIQAPSVTILGESTPEAFFEGLDVCHVAEGLIPRFVVIEYKGDRPPRNKNANIPPSDDLTQKFADLVACAITITNNNACCHVKFDDHSEQLLDRFDSKADLLINSSKHEVETQVWNRAHLKALKLSALIAVGINPHNPVVTEDVAKWTIDFITRDCLAMTERFKTGDVGTGDSKQINDLKRIISIYYKNAPSNDAWVAMHRDKIIPKAFLAQRCYNLSSFKNDRLGAGNALDRAIKGMIESGLLIEMSKSDTFKRYSFTGVSLAISGTWE